ncbi:Isopropylmalate/homocitrate/citramalate synthase [Burkholderia pseudomallei]|nr:Isopropylmalate/homocitrate/citramalate synthase [Burkholderia pseudomallei]VBI73867.1 Isopropylmalate/homocitrate/citramalate synthase [Burkholderia pseudomallei]VCK07809.1 Isopropylmalate/homocitrate/citramalate synthase [Burkholderia pseudomallei]VCK13765.1 Isopropylmalate/homocitrate/citramalate synthase [Burkholderia pseudomallei]VCK13994.1 Isopropylmalate/homocitrate/citramalate synthase [Burkholderia pseudomallei]
MEPNARTMYEYGGYEIRVWASRNERGAWVSDVEIYRDGRRVLAAVPETVSPEWAPRRNACATRSGRGAT